MQPLRLEMHVGQLDMKSYIMRGVGFVNWIVHVPLFVPNPLVERNVVRGKGSFFTKKKFA